MDKWQAYISGGEWISPGNFGIKELAAEA